MIKKTEIQVRKASIDDVAPLERFYRKAYGDARFQYKYPLRWNWLYRSNPFIPEDFGLPLWIAVHQGEIVGHTGAMLVPCKINDKTRLAAWSVDTRVLPSYLGTGLGKRLQKANQDAHEIFMSLSMSPANRAIKKKLGAVSGPAAYLYVHTLRIDSALLFEGIRLSLQNRLGALAGQKAWQMLNISGIPWLFSKYLETRLRLRQSKQKFSLPGNSMHFTPVSRFGPEADQLWETCRSEYNFCVERTSTYLNWKYVDQPHISYNRFYAYKNDRLAGLIVFRVCQPPEPRLGVIAELLCAPGYEHTGSDFIGFAVKKLYQKNVSGIYCASALPGHQKDMANHGLLSLSKEEMCLFDRKQNAHSGNRQWHALLAKGDHDWDQYPFTRQISISEIRQILKQRKTAAS